MRRRLMNSLIEIQDNGPYYQTSRIVVNTDKPTWTFAEGKTNRPIVTVVRT